MAPWGTQSQLSLQFTRGLVVGYAGEAAGRAPHGLHADLVIGFLYRAWYRTGLDTVGIYWGRGLAIPSRGFVPPVVWGFGLLPAPPAHILQGSYLGHASLVTSSDFKHYTYCFTQIYKEKTRKKNHPHGAQTVFYQVMKQKPAQPGITAKFVKL